MTTAAKVYSAYQSANPEGEFNEDLIYWRDNDNVRSYLEDMFVSLELIPGIKFKGVRIERDETRFPSSYSLTSISPSRFDLAYAKFDIPYAPDREDRLDATDVLAYGTKEITLTFFVPKLLDGLFYQLNGSTYFPILQLVDRGTYCTKKTLTLKTLLMPLTFRRDISTEAMDLITGVSQRVQIYALDLFRQKLNVFTYFFAAKGLVGTLEFFDVAEHVKIVPSEDLEWLASEGGAAGYLAYGVAGPAKIAVIAERDWVAEDERHRIPLLVSLADALGGVARTVVETDDRTAWKKRLGKAFTSSTSGQDERADKVLVSLERILDSRTKKNLRHIAEEDKADVFCILRYIMRRFHELENVDTHNITNKRIRVAEYLIYPLLTKFSDQTYRLLNAKKLVAGKIREVFKQFTSEDPERVSPQAHYLIRKVITSELLRYSNLVNSFDLLLALRWTSRSDERGRSDVPLRARGHHPSYLGRVGLSTASASDPGTSGTLVPFCKTKGSFFI